MLKKSFKSLACANLLQLIEQIIDKEIGEEGAKIGSLRDTRAACEGLWLEVSHLIQKDELFSILWHKVKKLNLLNSLLLMNVNNVQYREKNSYKNVIGLQKLMKKYRYKDLLITLSICFNLLFYLQLLLLKMVDALWQSLCCCCNYPNTTERTG